MSNANGKNRGLGDGAWLYYNRIEEPSLKLVFYQIGVSVDPPGILNTDASRHATLLHKRFYPNREDAAAEEKRILCEYGDYLYQGSAKIVKRSNSGLFTKDVLGKFDEYLKWNEQGQRVRAEVDKLRVWNRLLADEYRFFKGGGSLDDLIRIYKRMRLADLDHMGADYWDRIIIDTIAAKTKIQPRKP